MTALILFRINGHLDRVSSHKAYVALVRVVVCLCMRVLFIVYMQYVRTSVSVLLKSMSSVPGCYQGEACEVME